MTHFEIDLSTTKAASFDRVLNRYVEAELLFRPDVDIKITRYSKEPGVERRAVFLSDKEHMAALLHQLQMAIS